MMTEFNQLPTPAVRSKVFDACVAIYSQMRLEAVFDEELESDIWTGSWVQLAERAGLYPRKATEAREHMHRMGCVEFFQLGRKGKPTVARLIRQPTPELWVGSKPTVYDAFRPAESIDVELIVRVDKLEQQMRGLMQFLAEKFPEDVRRSNAQSDGPRDSQAVSEMQADNGGSEHDTITSGRNEQSNDRGVPDGGVPVGQDSRTKDDSNSQ